jgi:hypothetical protein
MPVPAARPPGNGGEASAQGIEKRCGTRGRGSGPPAARPRRQDTPSSCLFAAFRARMARKTRSGSNCCVTCRGRLFSQEPKRDVRGNPFPAAPANLPRGFAGGPAAGFHARQACCLAEESGRPGAVCAAGNADARKRRRSGISARRGRVSHANPWKGSREASEQSLEQRFEPAARTPSRKGMAQARGAAGPHGVLSTTKRM